MSALDDWAQSTAPVKPAQGLDDVDEVAVERACRGDRTVRLNRAEMAAAFLWLDSHGYSLVRMGAILGVTSRTILRWRTARHFPLPRASVTSRNGGPVWDNGAGRNGAENATPALDPPFRSNRKEGPW